MKTEVLVRDMATLKIGDEIKQLPNWYGVNYAIVLCEIKPVVDGLTACKAYLEGKRITRKGEAYCHLDKALCPDFRLNDWEIVE